MKRLRVWLPAALAALLLGGCYGPGYGYGPHMGPGGHHGGGIGPGPGWQQGPADEPCPEGPREGRPARRDCTP